MDEIDEEYWFFNGFRKGSSFIWDSKLKENIFEKGILVSLAMAIEMCKTRFTSIKRNALIISGLESLVDWCSAIELKNFFKQTLARMIVKTQSAPNPPALIFLLSENLEYNFNIDGYCVISNLGGNKKELTRPIWGGSAPKAWKIKVNGKKFGGVYLKRVS